MPSLFSVFPTSTCTIRSKPLVKSWTFEGGSIKNLQAAGDRWQELLSYPKSDI